MDSSLHSHIASLYIQERIAVAQRERPAREIRRTGELRAPRLRPLRRGAPPPVRGVGAGPA